MRRHHRIAGVSIIALSVGILVASASSAATIWVSTHSTRTSPSAVTLSPSYRAIWPVTPTTSGYTSPTVAARGFAVSLLHMSAPVIGAFSARSATTGVVSVRTASRGLLTNVHVEKFTGAKGWWVVSSTTADIALTSPVALTNVTSPMTLAGSSVAFEAVINISLYVDGRAMALVSASAMGGGTQMAPFHATLHFANGSHRYGTLIVYTRSMKDGRTAIATARRIFLK